MLAAGQFLPQAACFPTGSFSELLPFFSCGKADEEHTNGPGSQEARGSFRQADHSCSQPGDGRSSGTGGG